MVASLVTAQREADSTVTSDRYLHRLRTNVTDISLQNGNPVGDNFVGNGLNGGLGFGLRSQWYIVKGLYLGGALSNDFMRVKNTEVTGLFQRSTKFNAYVYAGYDYPFANLWHVTADIGIGYSQNKNRPRNSGKFRDDGTLLRFTTSIEFEVSPRFSIFASPSFETVDYKIRTAAALGDQFNHGNYINMALGMRFIIENSNVYRPGFIKRL